MPDDELTDIIHQAILHYKQSNGKSSQNSSKNFVIYKFLLLSFYLQFQAYKMPEIYFQKDLTILLYTICLQNKTGIGHFYRIASITSLVSQDMSRIACIKENYSHLEAANST